MVTQLRETPLVPQGRTRAAIVEAALKVFATEGSTATLDEVAVAAGISRATLYRHFSSREELFAALLDEAYADVLARMRAANTDEVPFGEALARAARATAVTGTQFIALCSDSGASHAAIWAACIEAPRDSNFPSFLPSLPSVRWSHS